MPSLLPADDVLELHIAPGCLLERLHRLVFSEEPPLKHEVVLLDLQVTRHLGELLNCRVDVEFIGVFVHDIRGVHDGFVLVLDIRLVETAISHSCAVDFGVGRGQSSLAQIELVVVLVGRLHHGAEDTHVPETTRQNLVTSDLQETIQFVDALDVFRGHDVGRVSGFLLEGDVGVAAINGHLASGLEELDELRETVSLFNVSRH